MNESDVLYLAIGSKYGVEIKTSDFIADQHRFYTARRKLEDPSLASLQFRRGPTEGTLWIVKLGDINAT